MTTPKARLLAESVLGIDLLMALDRVGIGVFSRSSERSRTSRYAAIEQENCKLHAIIADALAALPFKQRLRLIHAVLGIPSRVPGGAHENVVRGLLRRRVRPKRIRIQG